MQDERKRANDLKDELEDKISFLNKNNNQNIAKITEMEIKLEKSKKEYEEKYQEFESKQQDYVSQRDTLKSTIDQTTNEITLLRNEYDAKLKAKREELNAKIETKNAELLKVKSTHFSLEQENLNFLETKNSLQIKLNNLVQVNNSKVSLISDLRKELEEVQRTLETQKEKKKIINE